MPINTDQNPGIDPKLKSIQTNLYWVVIKVIKVHDFVKPIVVKHVKSREYMTLTSIFVICDTALTRGNFFDKHDKSRHYLTLVTVEPHSDQCQEIEPST